MAITYLSDLHPDLQKEVLEKHPEFHSYGLQQQVEAMRKVVHNANKRTNKENKQERQIKAAVETIRAKREEAQSEEAPQRAEVEQPAAPPTVAAPKVNTTKEVTGGTSAAEVLQVLNSKNSEGNYHQAGLLGIAGQMLDHINSHPETHSDDIRGHLERFQDSIGLHRFSHSLSLTSARDPRAANAAKAHIQEAHQHLAAAANIFHNRFKDFSSNGVSLGDQSAVIANDYIAEHAGTVRSKENKDVDISDMSHEQLRQGLLTGKLKDESSDEGSRKFAARMRGKTFWKDQETIRAAKQESASEKAQKEIDQSDNKQKKDPSNPLKDVKARRGNDGTRIITEALGKRRLHVQKILGTNVAPVSPDLPGRVRGKFEPEPVAPVAPVAPRPTAAPTRKQLKKRKSAKTASRKAELVEHSATALRALTSGASIPKESQAVIDKKPGLMDALNKEATRRQISRAGHTAAFDAARGADVPDREA